MKPQKDRHYAIINPLTLIILIFLLAMPLSVQANQLYVYSYTGGAFDSTSGPDFPDPPSNYKISISFIDGPLGSWTTSMAAWNDFTITDGKRNFTATGSDMTVVTILALTTSGLPADWIFDFTSATHWELLTFGEVGLSGEYGQDFSRNLWSTASGTNPTGFSDAGAGSPGTWTSIPYIQVSEPSSWLLLCIGLCLLLVSWRRLGKGSPL